jgi:hypothetical protein
MADQEDVRRLALGQPEAVEQPHFDRSSFRVRGKIFATIRAGEGTTNLALPPKFAASLLETEPKAVRPINWGSVRGWVSVDLAALRPGLLEQLIEAAWSRVAPKALLKARDAAA